MHLRMEFNSGVGPTCFLFYSHLLLQEIESQGSHVMVMFVITRLRIRVLVAVATLVSVWRGIGV